MNDAVKISEIHAGREVVYNSISKFYLYPPCDEYYRMLETLLPKMEYMFESVDENIKSGISDLNLFLSKRSKLSKEALKEFELENLRVYTRLFCLTDSAPISESYYTSREKLVMQESRDQIYKMFKNTGFKPNIKSNEPEDHFALELMFMSYLAMKTKNSLLKNDEAQFEAVIKYQHDLLNKHLLIWVDEFLNRVAFFDEAHAFYLPLTKFIIGYIKEDAEFISDAF